LSLNRVQRLSVTDLKTSSNSPEVDQVQQTERSLKVKMFVYVISNNGIPLMPCSYAKSKRMVKKGVAKVVKLYPFTIQLKFECENQVQEVSLGIDSGYKNIGFSCITKKDELISGTLILDGRTSERLASKKMYRVKRRSKLWYRKPRFLNRKINKGWLAPSIQRRYDTHLNLINKLKAILPISKITIEIANFDIQKIENPDITNEGYQQGDMYGYQNTRTYLMAREHGLCQLCKKGFTKGSPSHIHHCKQRNEQGSNRVKNLALLHKKCHIKLHKKGLKLSSPRDYKANTFMSIINERFHIDIPELNITFGYKTFVDRNKLGLEKTHYNDAFVIANGSNQDKCKPIEIKQKHKNNRKLQIQKKGHKPAIRRQRYKIQPKDLIWVSGKRYIAEGTQDKGRYIIIQNSKRLMPTKNIEKIYNFGSIAYN
jgi:hypothetical protein